MSTLDLDRRRTAARARLGAWAALTALGACAPRVRPVPPDVPIDYAAFAGPCSMSFEHVAAVDEPTELGFSAVEAVQRLSGPRTSPLVWLAGPRTEEYAFEFGPERTVSSLSLALTLAPGEIHLRRAVPRADAERDVECGPDVLSIPVDVVLQSADQALDESFRAVLEASSPHRGRLAARFERGALAGGLVFSEPDSFDPKRSFHVGAMDLELLVWQGGSHGTLHVEVGASPRPADGSLAQRPLDPRPSIAAWPSAAHCSAGWVALPSDATLSGTSVAGVVAALGEQPAEQLRWSDGSVAELQLAFDAPPEELCQSTGDVLEFDTALRARSSDRRIDSALPVRVVAAADGRARWREIELIRVLDDERAEETAAATPEPPGDETATFVEVEARYSRDGASGSLRVHAAHDAAESGAALVTSGEWSR